MRFTTKLLHGNFAPDGKTGATTTPIYQSAASRQENAEDLEENFAGRKPDFYILESTIPTTRSIFYCNTGQDIAIPIRINGGD